jgi:hypothetical protein
VITGRREERDCLLFHEHFHGVNGAGLGASHQTGWTGLVAKLIQLCGYLDPPGAPGGRQSCRLHPRRIRRVRRKK